MAWVEYVSLYLVGRVVMVSLGNTSPAGGLGQLREEVDGLGMMSSRIEAIVD